MPENLIYRLGGPPELSELPEGTNFLTVFDEWAHFKSALSGIASDLGISVEEAINRPDLYQQALDYVDMDREDWGMNDGGGVGIIV